MDKFDGLEVGCIVSNFYIKSQQIIGKRTPITGCIVSNFYIKSQQLLKAYADTDSCIVSNFYIKSQPQALRLLIIKVLRLYVPRKKRCSAN